MFIFNKSNFNAGCSVCLLCNLLLRLVSTKGVLCTSRCGLSLWDSVNIASTNKIVNMYIAPQTVLCFVLKCPVTFKVGVYNKRTLAKSYLDRLTNTVQVKTPKNIKLKITNMYIQLRPQASTGVEQYHRLRE